MKKHKLLAILFAGTMVFSSIALAGCGSSSESSGGSSSEQTIEEKCPPITNKENLSNRQYYKDVITQYKDAGFTNIITRKAIANADAQGLVSEITINGEKDFSPTDRFPSDSRVVIVYFVVEKSEEENEVTEESTIKPTENQKNTTSVTQQSSTASSTTNNSELSKLYNDNINKINSFGNTYKTKLESVFNSVGDSYDKYVANKGVIENWYTSLKTDYKSLFEETENVTKNYFESVKSNIPASNYDKWTNEFENVYKDYYKTAYEKIYKDIYKGVFEDIYDKYYKTVLNKQPNNVNYDIWYETRSDFYDLWYDEKSDFYDNWYESKSDFYDNWYEAKSDMYDDWYESQ